MQARFDFSLEGHEDDGDLNSHGDLPHCSLSDSVVERDMRGERVLFNSPWEFVEHMACHFESL
jgi:hypothetical protein